MRHRNPQTEDESPVYFYEDDRFCASAEQTCSVYVCVCVFVYLVVLSMQEKVKRDEVVVMSWRLHVEDKAMDAVLDERPQEPAEQKERWEHVLMDRDGEV